MNGTALRVATAWIVAALMLPSTATAKPSPAQKCAAAKQKAAGKASACQLKCTGKAALGGLPASDPDLLACLDKCRMLFASAFAKAEAKGGCDPAGDAAAVAGKVDDCAIDIAYDLQPGGGSPTCTVPFRADARDIVDGFAFSLSAAGNLDVPASCGGSQPVCCPGGSPSSPCGPLHFDFVPRAGESGVTIAVGAGDPNQLDADIPVRLTTITDLPVTLPVIGDCGIRVDTSPGPSARVHILVPVQFSADRLRMGPVGAITLTGLTTDDIVLSGGIGCQIANLPLIIDTLTSTIRDTVSATFDNLCRRCCSGDIAQCAP